MVRSTLRALVTSLSLMVSCAALCRAQTLVNPGFETTEQAHRADGVIASGKADIRGTLAQGWQDNTNWADVKLDYSLDTANPHGGKLSQKVVITRGFAQYVQPMRFSTGNHAAAVWVRASTPMWVSVSLRQGPEPYTTYASSATQVAAKWTKVRAAGRTPDVDGMVIINAYGPGTVWIDDAEYGVSTTEAVTIKPNPLPVPRSYFGLNVNHMHNGAGFLWPALDFGAYRTWDSDVTWALIQREGRDKYDWSKIDRDVEQAAKHDTQFLLTLGQTPRWASSQPDKPAVYGIGLGAPPTNIDDWKQFVKAVATRFKGRIHAYEIWNEPDIDMFYTGTPEQMVPLEKATAEVVHSIDPKAVIVSAAVSSGHSINALRWLDAYLKAGGGKYSDVIAFHLYTSAPELDVNSLRNVRALLARYGMAAKPIWNTESGLDITGRSDAETTGYIARQYILDWALGFQRFYLYAYDNQTYTGLDIPGRPDQLAPTGVAYREVKRWLQGACMKSCGSDKQGVWVCALELADGTPAWIVWHPDGNHDFAAPEAWKVSRLNDLTGAQRTFTGNQVQVGVAPILLSR